MKNELNVMVSKLNGIGKDFDYRKKEILFDRFCGWFDGTKFHQINEGFMGWIEYQSVCGQLFVSTASFDGGNWLRHVRHRDKANNVYNNFVNAFAYWDLMNENGKAFWLNYYSGEIALLKAGINGKIGDFKAKIKNLEIDLIDINNEVIALTPCQ